MGHGQRSPHHLDFVPGSLSQGSSIPSMGALQISLYSWYPLTTPRITLDTVTRVPLFS